MLEVNRLPLLTPIRVRNFLPRTSISVKASRSHAASAARMACAGSSLFETGLCAFANAESRRRSANILRALTQDPLTLFFKQLVTMLKPMKNRLGALRGSYKDCLFHT